MTRKTVINKGHLCSVETCDTPATRKLLCSKHYKRMKKYGDPLIKRAPIIDKVCPVCSLTKDVSQFYSKSENSGWLRSKCISCYAEDTKHRYSLKDPEIRRAQSRARYAKDPAKAAASSRKQRFGITQEDYDLMLLRQNMTCGICKSSEPRARWDKFQVDHDHDSGQVRGLLCGPCNRILGQGGDKSDVLQAGADYLKRWGK